ncbi:MAG: 2-hydroxyacid dehydrogenase [Mesorhizobium sp.]|nr:2-hydroxyacid dehydrogenase [Mesorhizobium sp.]MBL8578456.1 2-hydroxyacid dehydrogenase [Mesorhizobium sp.]
MTANDLSRITILVPGKLNAHAAERIRKTFDMVTMDVADSDKIPADLAEKVRGIAAFGGISAAFMKKLPKLEIVASFGVGYDSVDAAHAGKTDVMVTNTPDVLTEEVADTALGLLINTVREFPKAENYLREGRWVKEGPYRLTAGTLRGRNAGIFGMGRIGQAIARRLEAFGLSVAYHNRRQVEGLPYEYHPTLVSLASAVDTLISVVPGGPSTAKAVNTEVLKALGPSGVFVNIGRGSTVDEDALATALADGTIYAAGLDVFADEPNVPKALLDVPNASLLPHVGSASIYTRNAMADLVVDNLISWFAEGKPVTAVPETAHVKAK